MPPCDPLVRSDGTTDSSQAFFDSNANPFGIGVAVVNITDPDTGAYMYSEAL